LILGAALIMALNLPESTSQHGKALIREFLAPLQGLIAGVTHNARQWFGAVRGLGDMALDNRNMAAELTRLRSELRYLEALEQENIELRAQLGYLSRPERELIPAEVIARDISGWWQTLRIGKGLAEGVEPHMAVVTADGLVGRTMNVSAGTADVLLISDPSCRVSAYVPRVRAHGVTSGRGLSPRGLPLLRMQFIDKDADIRPGDEVVTSGLGGTYPRGLLIGYVERIVMDDSNLYQVADIAPTADLGRLAYCFVIAETSDPVETLLRRREAGGAEP
jgi:rod shape-determining protein MreC